MFQKILEGGCFIICLNQKLLCCGLRHVYAYMFLTWLSLTNCLEFRDKYALMLDPE